jgi:hypothetical protein
VSSLTSATTNGVSISNNTIIGPLATASTFGISAGALVGAITNVLVGPNTITNFAQGVSVGGAVTNFCVPTGANFATTPTSGTSGSTCH